ncbi:hypothetical protein R8Z50_12445 [Longispora sp. K20-0274]|uniref:DUF3885 domain-containing protein n=1 Tax=Longispora sp. K20-0274 TaxID=3088255 RepID=UPI00399B33D3
MATKKLEQPGGAMDLGPAEVTAPALDHLWAERWPECPPVPTRLRAAYPDRWIRFRALPDGRRCPDTPAEYAEVLGRHHAVLDGLVTDGSLLVLTADYSETAPPHTDTEDGVYWTSVLLTDARTGYEIHQVLRARRVDWTPGCLDPLLRPVVGDLSATVLLADNGLRWLYHPFAGGMDVIVATGEERDALADRHRAWRSSRASGL